MGIGTSLGAFFEDDFHQIANPWLDNPNSTPDNNELSTNEVMPKPDEEPKVIQAGFKEAKDKLLGTNNQERFQTWPERLVRSAFTLPGDVLSGKVEPGSIQEIERAADLAGLVVLGPAPVAAKLAEGTLGSFAGIKSKTFPKDKLHEAQGMELSKAHPDDIWKKTGFFRGADERWRYEIPDKDAEIKMDAFEVKGLGDSQTISIKGKPDMGISENLEAWFKSGDQYNTKTLGQIIDHPELFKAYPESAKVKVELLPDSLVRSGAKGQYKAGSKGGFEGDTIYLAPGHPEYTRSVLLHEIQHGIQNHEGFSYGTSIGALLPPGYAKVRGNVKGATQDLYEKMGKAGLKDFDLMKDSVEFEASGFLDIPNFLSPSLKQMYADNVKKAKESGFYTQLKTLVSREKILNTLFEEASNNYKNLMGEVEARNVQARENFGEFQRKLRSPMATEDTPRHLQINPK